MNEYDVNEHAMHIFETGLDGFFNYLSTQCDLGEVMWNAFDEINSDKLSDEIDLIIHVNQWKQPAFDMLDKGNCVLWDNLRDYAQKLHDDAEFEHMASMEADKEWTDV